MRMMIYDTREIRKKTSRVIYSAGHVYEVPEHLATEWMEGYPPPAWPEKGERPLVEPPSVQPEEKEQPLIEPPSVDPGWSHEVGEE